MQDQSGDNLIHGETSTEMQVSTGSWCYTRNEKRNQIVFHVGSKAVDRVALILHLIMTG